MLFFGISCPKCMASLSATAPFPCAAAMSCFGAVSAERSSPQPGAPTFFLAPALIWSLLGAPLVGSAGINIEIAIASLWVSHLVCRDLGLQFQEHEPGPLSLLSFWGAKKLQIRDFLSPCLRCSRWGSEMQDPAPRCWARAVSPPLFRADPPRAQLCVSHGLDFSCPAASCERVGWVLVWKILTQTIRSKYVWERRISQGVALYLKF